MSTILFKNATILLSDFNVVKDSYLGVNNDIIDYIGEEKPLKMYDEEIDCNKKLLMPGLINTHTHVAMTLLRGIGSDQNLQDWLFKSVFPIEDNLTSYDVHVASNLAMLEMLSTGTTSFSDMYFFSRDTARAVVDAGMKANISRSVVSTSEDEKWQDSYRIEEAKELFKNYNGAENGRIKVDFSLHAEYTGNDNITRYLGDICYENNSIFHIHVSETLKEHVQGFHRRNQKTPTSWLEDLGVLRNKCLFAHCVHCTDQDIDIMKDHNVSVSHCPTSNMKLGSGFAKIQYMIDKGLNVGLGTDGCASNNNLNMFEEMHVASVIHNGYNHDPTIMKAKDIVNMATQGGAKAQDRLDTGSLEVGKKADIIAIDLDKPHLVPNIDTLALTCYSVQGSDVCMTMVDGKILYKDGEFKTIDKDKTYYEVGKIVDRLYNC